MSDPDCRDLPLEWTKSLNLPDTSPDTPRPLSPWRAMMTVESEEDVGVMMNCSSSSYERSFSEEEEEEEERGSSVEGDGREGFFQEGERGGRLTVRKATRDRVLIRVHSTESEDYEDDSVISLKATVTRLEEMTRSMTHPTTTERMSDIQENRRMTLPAMMVTPYSGASSSDSSSGEEASRPGTQTLPNRTGFRRQARRRKMNSRNSVPCGISHTRPDRPLSAGHKAMTLKPISAMPRNVSRSTGNLLEETEGVYQSPTNYLTKRDPLMMAPPLSMRQSVSPTPRRRSSLLVALSGMLSKSQSNLLDVGEEVFTVKAKSISEQLERIKSNLNKTAGIPPLDFTDWKELVPQSIVETLGKKEMEQQHHIWELITTEHNHITIISTVINSLLTCLKELHNENFLTKINVHDVFLNIERIREVHLAFWNDCIVPLIDTARDTGELLNPELLTESSILFEEDLNHPLFEYCIKYIESRSYIKSQQHKNNDFKEYINWCSNEIRVQHNKLGVDDILIKPIQRIQKYPILIRDILRKTSDDDTRSVIASFLEKVKVFVEALNRRKEEKEEQQKIEGIKERIESYSVLPSVSNNTNDQINQILNKYNKFDLADKVPLLNTQRKFLHETSCKLDSKLDSKTQDVTLFLFSDHILVTRPNKGSKKKNRIIKQPMTLDRVEIEELHYASHTNVVVYLNEYGSLVDMFLLQSHSQESHTTLLNAVIQAKDNYKREKNKLYTEMDATKSVSTCSMNSAGNQQAESPAIARHVACSVTRSHSELGPTRRNMVDPASSVSRAQSMPASNDKRNHLPQSQSISSASSSSSSSSCSVSEGCNSEGSSRLATLSHIKESDKSLDSGEESTVIPNSDTLTGGTDPDTLKNYGPDVYIDNLSTEFKGKLDINKNICDTVNLQAADEKLFTKSDAIFIDHSNAQSES